eukprot:scaffold6224_cov52-Attheya_sp.AAC.4
MMMVARHNEEVSASQASHRRFVSGKRYNMMHDVEEAIVQHDPDVIMKVNEMIERLEHLYQQEQEGLDEFKPDVNAYNLLLNAHAKSNAKDAPQKAEQVLNNMISSETIQPNAVSYTEVIDAYARSKKTTAPKEAERVLFQLMNASANEVALHLPLKKLAPTSVTCNAVINAWAQQGTRDAAERAEGILDRMEQWTKNDGSLLMRPTAYSYSTVIYTWARSQDKDGPTRADALLERSLEMYKSFPNVEELKPTVLHFLECGHSRPQHP